MQTTTKTSLPFKRITPKEREADVIPHLQQSLMSKHKMLEEGYTKVFHTGNKGVIIYEPDTLNITLNKPPVLQGCKEEGQKCGLKQHQKKKMKSTTSTTYHQQNRSMRYLHATAGFPAKSTWMQAIKAGNYVKWPRLTPKIVGKHFLESDKLHKGHMKQQ